MYLQPKRRPERNSSDLNSIEICDLTRYSASGSIRLAKAKSRKGKRGQPDEGLSRDEDNDRCKVLNARDPPKKRKRERREKGRKRKKEEFHFVKTNKTDRTNLIHAETTRYERPTAIVDREINPSTMKEESCPVWCIGSWGQRSERGNEGAKRRDACSRSVVEADGREAERGKAGSWTRTPLQSRGSRRSWPALIRHLMLEGGVPGPEDPGAVFILLRPPSRNVSSARFSTERIRERERKRGRKRERERERELVSLGAVIARDLKPRPPPTGTRIVIVSEIADPQDSHRHRRPPFSFLSSSIPSYLEVLVERRSRGRNDTRRKIFATIVYSNFSSLLVYHLPSERTVLLFESSVNYF